MVDVIKFASTTQFSSSKKTVLGRKSPYDTVTLPIFLSAVNSISLNDRATTLNNISRWVGRRPGDPPRLIDLPCSPYNIHRKIMYYELARQCTTRVDIQLTNKNKQQLRGTSKDTNKSTTTAATKTTAATSLSGIDCQSSRLFGALSKHVTVKPEPLRQSNNFASALTSWQRYWASTHTQRRRQQANEAESVFYRQKRDQPLAATTHFVLDRESTFYSNEYSHSRSSSAQQQSNSPRKIVSPIILTTSRSATPTSPVDNTKKEELPVSLPEITSSTFSPRTNTPPMPSITVSVRNVYQDNKKTLTQTSSSHFKSDSILIDEVAEAQKSTNKIITKVYRLPLPSGKLSDKKKAPKKVRPEKKQVLPPAREKKDGLHAVVPKTSESKRKRQGAAHTASNKPRRSSNKKSTEVSGSMTPMSKSKYSEVQWYEPYTGLRFDPPTPPCSPSLFLWPHNNDRDENDTPFVKSETCDGDFYVPVFENCQF